MAPAKCSKMVPWLITPHPEAFRDGVGWGSWKTSKTPAKITWQGGVGGGKGGSGGGGGVGGRGGSKQNHGGVGGGPGPPGPPGPSKGWTLSSVILLPADQQVTLSQCQHFCQGPPGLPEPPPPPTILPACAPEIRLDFLVLLLCCVFSTNPSFELLQGGGSSKIISGIM